MTKDTVLILVLVDAARFLPEVCAVMCDSASTQLRHVSATISSVRTSLDMSVHTNSHALSIQIAKQSLSLATKHTDCSRLVPCSSYMRTLVRHGLEIRLSASLCRAVQACDNDGQCRFAVSLESWRRRINCDKHRQVNASEAQKFKNKREFSD